MILGNTSSLVRGKLGGAADPAPTFSAWYKDKNLMNGEESGGFNSIAANGATAVNIVAAPAERTLREVQGLTCYNGDNAAVTATIELYNGTTAYTMVTITLQTLEMLVYEKGAGWQVFDVNGNLRYNAV